MRQEPRSSEVTRLLSVLRGGDRSALDRLLPHVYDDLRALARGHARHEWTNARAWLHAALYPDGQAAP